MAYSCGPPGISLQACDWCKDSFVSRMAVWHRYHAIQTSMVPWENSISVGTLRAFPSPAYPSHRASDGLHVIPY